MACSGFDATTIATDLLGELRAYVRPRRLVIITGADGGYKFSAAKTGLLPDVGFIAMARAALITNRSRPIPFAPDQTVDEMAAKARRYLSGGTRLGWILWPTSGHIDVWRPDQTVGPAVTLNMRDTLEGEDVLPGFSYPVADVFADPFA